MPRSDRPGARGRDPADRGRPAGRGARRRRAERLAASARSRGVAGRGVRGAARQPSARARARRLRAAMRRSRTTLLGDDPAGDQRRTLEAIARGGDAVRSRPRARLCGGAAHRALRHSQRVLGLGHARCTCFTYANAVHRLLERVSVVRARRQSLIRSASARVFHGAMALYLTRFLNQPPARLPGERGRASGRSARQTPTRSAGRCWTRSTGSSRSIRAPAWSPAISLLGHPSERLIATLGHALLREDADFHTYQMFEAGAQAVSCSGAPRPRAAIS